MILGQNKSIGQHIKQKLTFVILAMLVIFSASKTHASESCAYLNEQGISGVWNYFKLQTNPEADIGLNSIWRFFPLYGSSYTDLPYESILTEDNKWATGAEAFGGNVLSYMFKIFNYAALGAGIIFLVVNLIMLISHGTGTGKLNDTNALPWDVFLKISLGMLFVLPVGEMGYSMAQRFFMWIILHGMAAGNTVWTTAVCSIYESGHNLFSGNSISDIADVDNEITKDNMYEILTKDHINHFLYPTFVPDGLMYATFHKAALIEDAWYKDLAGNEDIQDHRHFRDKITENYQDNIDFYQGLLMAMTDRIAEQGGIFETPNQKVRVQQSDGSIKSMYPLLITSKETYYLKNTDDLEYEDALSACLSGGANGVFDISDKQNSLCQNTVYYAILFEEDYGDIARDQFLNYYQNIANSMLDSLLKIIYSESNGEEDKSIIKTQDIINNYENYRMAFRGFIENGLQGSFIPNLSSESTVKDLVEKGWLYAGFVYQDLYEVSSPNKWEYNYLLESVDDFQFQNQNQSPIYRLNDYENIYLDKDLIKTYSTNYNELHSIAEEINLELIEDKNKGLNQAIFNGLPRSNSDNGLDQPEDLNAFKLPGSGSISGFSEEVNKLISYLASEKKNVDKYNSNVIKKIKSEGENMQNKGFDIILAFSITSTALIAISGICLGEQPANNLVRTGIELSQPIVYFIGTSLITQGAILGIAIPLIPIVIWSVAVFAWLGFIIEGMAAMILAGIAMMWPKAPTKMWGKAEPAVMLTLNAFLRPSLYVLGLIAALIILNYSTFIYSVIFSWAFNSGLVSIETRAVIDEHSIPGLIVSGGYIAALVVIIRLSFAMITYVPDKMMRWIGGSGSDYNSGYSEYGDAAGQQVTAQTASGASKSAEANQTGGQMWGTTAGNVVTSAGIAIASGKNQNNVSTGN